FTKADMARIIPEGPFEQDRSTVSVWLCRDYYETDASRVTAGQLWVEDAQEYFFGAIVIQQTTIFVTGECHEMCV
ncbi:MAG: hypothetical protein JXM70_24520, partial [Pirellulales bacterium]|nr:hypothetical protein [Pirellulales bacterium]